MSRLNTANATAVVGDDAGVARRLVEQRELPEEAAGSEPGDLAAAAQDVDLALRDEEELVADVALVDDLGSGFDRAQLGPRQAGPRAPVRSTRRTWAPAADR